MNDDDEEIIVIDQAPKMPVYTLPPHLKKTFYNPKNYCPRCFEYAIQGEKSYYCIHCGYDWLVSVIDSGVAG